MVRAYIDGAAEMGIPRLPDTNLPDPVGVGPGVCNIRDDVRQSAVVSHLDPARERPNLTIKAEAPVLGLTLSGSRVDAVRYEKDGKVHTDTAGQVVLAAGAYRSPQLLLLSGIGPAAELEALGIEVTHALDGVGRNFQDHASIHMTFAAAREFEVDWTLPRLRLMARSAAGLDHGDFSVTLRPPTQIQDVGSLLPPLRATAGAGGARTDPPQQRRPQRLPGRRDRAAGARRGRGEDGRRHGVHSRPDPDLTHAGVLRRAAQPGAG